MELTPETLAQEQHKSWLAHPCTIQMLKLMDEHKMVFVDNMAKMSSDTSTPDTTFRSGAYAIATIDTIKRLMTNTDVFVRKTIKQK
jgi:hypothetical protein